MMNKRKMVALGLSTVLGLSAALAIPFLAITAQAKNGTPAESVGCQVSGSVGYGPISDNLSAVHDGTDYLVEPYAGEGDGNPYVVTNYEVAQSGNRDLNIYFNFWSSQVSLTNIYLYCFVDSYSADVPESIELYTDTAEGKVMLDQYEPVVSEYISSTCYLIEYVNTGDPVVIDNLRVTARAKDEVRSSGQKCCVGFYEIDWDGDLVEPEPVEYLGDWYSGSPNAVGSYEETNKFLPPWNAVDGDINTLWHTDWNGCTAEERYFEVWMQRVYQTSGLRYYSRPGNKSGDNNGRVGKYQVYVGGYGGEYKLVAEGEWEDTEGWKEVTWEPTEGSFIKLVGVTTYGTTPNKWMSASEIQIRAIY